MTISMYKVSVPIFVQLLTALSGVLGKAAAHAEAKHIDPAFLLGMRLYPDMYPLVRQVQQATAHPIRACSALSGSEPINLPNTETSFAALESRLANTIEYIKGLKPAQSDGTRGGLPLRPGRRPLRPSSHPDGGHRPVFGARIRLGFRAEPDGAPDPARALRRRHGRRMGCRRVADDGEHPAACPRLRLRPAAVGIPDRLFPGFDRLWRAVP